MALLLSALPVSSERSLDSPGLAVGACGLRWRVLRGEGWQDGAWARHPGEARHAAGT